jgi:hypothetical protein
LFCMTSILSSMFVLCVGGCLRHPTFAALPFCAAALRSWIVSPREFCFVKFIFANIYIRLITAQKS